MLRALLAICAFAAADAFVAPAGKAMPVARKVARGPAMSTNPDAPIKIGINGFGRIGRLVFRIAMARDDMVVKHINSPMAPEYMKYLLNYDSAHGRYKGTVEVGENSMTVDGLEISLSGTRDPTEIP